MYFLQKFKTGPSSLALRLASTLISVSLGSRILCLRVAGSIELGMWRSWASFSAIDRAALLMVIYIQYRQGMNNSQGMTSLTHSTILSMTFSSLSISLSSVLSSALRCFSKAYFFFMIVISFLFSANRSFLTEISSSMVARWLLMVNCSDCFSLFESISSLCRSISWASINFFISTRRDSLYETDSLASRSCRLKASFSSQHSFSFPFSSFFREAILSLNFSLWFLSYSSRLPNMEDSLKISSFICEFSFSRESLEDCRSARQEVRVIRSLSSLSAFLCSDLMQESCSCVSVSILFFWLLIVSCSSLSRLRIYRVSLSHQSCLLANSSSKCSMRALSFSRCMLSSYFKRWMV